jgi:hypothetical protein
VAEYTAVYGSNVTCHKGSEIFLKLKLVTSHRGLVAKKIAGHGIFLLVASGIIVKPLQDTPYALLLAVTYSHYGYS